MMIETISIIMIINNESIYKGFLDSLNNQDFKKIELIPIYNYDQEFNSASYAYNKYAKNAKGDLLIFMHPDIRFQDKHSLSNIIEYVNNLDDFELLVLQEQKGKMESEKS